MQLWSGKLIGGESELIKEMDSQALLNQIQNMITGVEERIERMRWGGRKGEKRAAYGNLSHFIKN